MISLLRSFSRGIIRRTESTSIKDTARIALLNILSSIQESTAKEKYEVDSRFFGIFGDKKRRLALKEEAKRELSEGRWNRKRVLDKRENIVFERLIDEGFTQSSKPSYVSVIAKTVESITGSGPPHGLVTTNMAESVIGPIDSEKLSEDSIREVLLQKYFDLEVAQGHFDYMPKDHPKYFGELLALTYLGIELDLNRVSITMGNLENAREFYFKANPDKDEKSFNDFVKNHIENILCCALNNEACRRWKEQVSDLDVSSQDFCDITSNFVKEIKDKARIHRATGPQVGIGDDVETHLINSPFRHDDFLRSGHSRINKYAFRVGNSLLINAVLEDAAKEACGEENYRKFFKQIEFAPVAGAVAFPRDYSVFHNGAFHQTEKKLAKAISDNIRNKDAAGAMFHGGSPGVLYAPKHLDRINSHKNDLEYSDYRVVQDIPFDAAGGNMIFTRNAQGGKVLIATVSDKYFKDDGEFVGGYMLDERGKVKDMSTSGLFISKSNMLLLTGEKYPKFRQKIIDWGESIGCDKVIVLDRNVTPPDKNAFSNFYHLDVFCGALPGGCVVINESAITAENMEQLKQVFGENKIIPLNQEEQSKLCANFVVFNRLVVMSDPETPQSFIDKLTERGFDVYVPPCTLTIPETQSAGWSAGIRCLTSTAIREANLLNEEEPPSTIGTILKSAENFCRSLLGQKPVSNQI